MGDETPKPRETGTRKALRKELAEDSAQQTALASPAGREWITHELEKAERAEEQGPLGQGWAHNEILRPAIVERAAFLRALVALLPK